MELVFDFCFIEEVVEVESCYLFKVSIVFVRGLSFVRYLVFV